MKRQVLPLGDSSAMEVSVVGGKSAGLSRALNAGLPVLDGFTLAVEASATTLSAAAAVLNERGSGAARLAIMKTEFPEPLICELDEAAKQLPEPLIVRSSVVLEHDGRWAGAFASLSELRREEVPKAIRSIWAGVFAMETLDRFEAAGIKPESALAGALIQPEIFPDYGGSASVDRRGIVSVAAVAGSPRDLLAGWVPGVQGFVAANGEVSGAEVSALLGEDLLGRVATLTRQVEAELKCNLIEWAACGDDLVLLQVMETLSPGGGKGIEGGGAEEGGDGGGMVLPAALGLPQARKMARLVAEYPGSLGEELVLSWRGAWDGSEDADPHRGSTSDGPEAEHRTGVEHGTHRTGETHGTDRTEGEHGTHSEHRTGETQRTSADHHGLAAVGAGGDRLDLLAEARRLADDLTAVAWGRPTQQASATAAAALRRLRGDRPDESLEALSALEAVDPAACRRLLNILEHLAAALPQPERIWYHTTEELAGVLSGAEPQRSGRVGRDRWEPFLAGVAALSGEARSGLAASGGVGAGRLSWVEQPSATDHVRPRDVIVVQYPLPNFAPLLWDAAGLVSLGGAPSAHLMEVARSLAVPAVVGCPIGDLLDGAGPPGGSAPPDGAHSEEFRIVAVDGDEGRVAVLQP